MGSGTFFSKFASMDPIAQAFNLPGAHKYAQLQASQDAGKSAYGPYTGVTPTLAAANAGYRPGGPGAVQGYQPWTPTDNRNWFQKFASGTGSTIVDPSGGLSGNAPGASKIQNTGF